MEEPSFWLKFIRGTSLYVDCRVTSECLRKVVRGGAMAEGDAIERSEAEHEGG